MRRVNAASDREHPRVTVLMPVYNRERFVDEAIRSVLEQDLDGLELVLVDDGSTDRTPEILGRWAERDARVVLVRSPANRGIPAALNLGLRHARAPYIARLDSDDVMLPGRLARQAEVLDRHREVVLVSCAYELMDVDGNPLGVWRGEEPHEVVTFLLNFFNIVGGGGQVMFRRDEVLEEGGYAEEFPSSEDYDLWVRLLRRGRILCLPFVGMRQRQHGARSHVQFASVKRRNWTAIMGDALRRTLGRPVTTEEIDALITLWRVDGRKGAAALADGVMREGFRHFRAGHSDEYLRGWVRRRIAQQWMLAARQYRDAGQRLEALRYAARAARWRYFR